MKYRKTPYLLILETRAVTGHEGVPASNLLMVVYPFLPICDTKAEYYSKSAMILENVHHQDPGRTRVESISAARLKSAEFIHSPGEVQKNQNPLHLLPSMGPQRHN